MAKDGSGEKDEDPPDAREAVASIGFDLKSAKKWYGTLKSSGTPDARTARSREVKCRRANIWSN